MTKNTTYISNYADWKALDTEYQKELAEVIVKALATKGRKRSTQKELEVAFQINRHIIVRLGELNGTATKGQCKGHRPPVIPVPIIFDIETPNPPHYVLANPRLVYSNAELDELELENEPDDETEGEIDPNFNPEEVYTKPRRRPQSFKSGDMDAVKELTPKGSLQVDGSLHLEGIPMIISYYMGLLGKALSLKFQHVELHHATGSITQNIGDVDDVET